MNPVLRGLTGYHNNLLAALLVKLQEEQKSHYSELRFLFKINHHLVYTFSALHVFPCHRTVLLQVPVTHHLWALLQTSQV